MTTITLPFPPASLSGHAKGHWRAKYGPTAWHRGWAKTATLAARPSVPAEGDIRIHVVFTPPNRRGDRTNFANRMKPYFDGIADALGVNDARFVPSYAFTDPDKLRPGVRITLAPAESVSLDGLSKSELVALKERIEDVLANRFAEAA